MFKKILAVAAVAATLPAHAVYTIATPATTVTESFDSLTTSTTSSAFGLANWSLANAAGTALTTYIAGNGNSSTGSIYSFGATGSTERALGSAASGGTYFGSPASGAVAAYIVTSFTNGTGAVLDSFTLKYDGEQWRNGGNTTAQSLTVQYGYGSSYSTVASWVTAGSSFNVNSLVNTGTAAAVVGNTTGLSANLGGTVATTWAVGDTLWVRWVDRNDNGNDHGLAIDNLSFSVTAIPAVPEPSTYAMLLAGLASVGFVARRRRA